VEHLFPFELFYKGSFARNKKPHFMKKNIGTVDRVLRVLIAAMIAELYFLQIISGATASILLVLAAIFLLTSLISFCPLYFLFGKSTCTKKQSGAI
jgi:hypothetical protein